jgi:chromosome partitioning protein
MALGHVIATMNIKGGVGKTTVALLLLQELIARGYKTALLDLDPNKPFVKFRNYRQNSGRDFPSTIIGLGEFDAKSFFPMVEELRESNDFIIIDCEGSQNFMLTKAASVTEAVIVPVNVSPLDSWSLP